MRLPTRSTFHPISTEMPFEAVFMRGGAGHACMDDLVVRSITAHRKPPEVRICRLRNQSRVGTVPPSTSTPHWPAC